MKKNFIGITGILFFILFIGVAANRANALDIPPLPDNYAFVSDSTYDLVADPYNTGDYILTRYENGMPKQMFYVSQKRFDEVEHTLATQHYTPEQKAILSNNFIQDILDQFAVFTGKDGKISSTLAVYAKRLFYTLAIIQIVWSVAMLLMGGEWNFQSFASLMIRQIIIICFFWYLIDHVYTHASNLRQYLMDITSQITGKNFRAADVGDLFRQVLKFATSIISSAAASPGPILPYVYAGICSIPCLITILSFMKIILKVLVVYINSFFAIAFSMLSLGLAALDATRHAAIQTLYKVASAILAYFTAGLLLSIIFTLTEKWTALATGMTAYDCMIMSFVVMAASFIFCGLVDGLPDFIASFVGGHAPSASIRSMFSGVAGSVEGTRAVRAAAIPFVGAGPLLSNMGGYGKSPGDVMRAHGAAGLAWNTVAGGFNALSRAIASESERFSHNKSGRFSHNQLPVFKNAAFAGNMGGQKGEGAFSSWWRQKDPSFEAGKQTSSGGGAAERTSGQQPPNIPPADIPPAQSTPPQSGTSSGSGGGTSSRGASVRTSSQQPPTNLPQDVQPPTQLPPNIPPADIPPEQSTPPQSGTSSGSSGGTSSRGASVRTPSQQPPTNLPQDVQPPTQLPPNIPPADIPPAQSTPPQSGTPTANSGNAQRFKKS